MRAKVSLLMQHGHPDAGDYAVHRVWEEAQLVVDRVNQNLSTETLLLQMAVSSLFSKEAGKDFQDIIMRLSNGS